MWSNHRRSVAFSSASLKMVKGPAIAFPMMVRHIRKAGLRKPLKMQRAKTAASVRSVRIGEIPKPQMRTLKLGLGRVLEGADVGAHHLPIHNKVAHLVDHV